MNARIRTTTIRLLMLGGGLLMPLAAHAAEVGPVPAAAIAELKAAVGSPQAEASAARRRLATKRVIRQAEQLLDAHPDAANRFEVLSLLFHAQQRLLAHDDSPANRAAIIETSRMLAEAPDAYAELRLDADLLLTQAEAARQGADGETRMRAIEPLLERYRGTPAEGRILRIATMLALELGDQRLIDRLRRSMETRFAGDLEMIEFMREKLGGQVFAAAFCGVFESSSGERLTFPMACLGRTTLLYFWSQEDGDGESLARLATAWKKRQGELAGRLQLISCNVDDLPDAGAGILREAGADWPALRLPGGRDHPAYRAFGRSDPKFVVVSPTGYAAIVMAGATRRRATADDLPDYDRMLESSLAREWTDPAYLAQLVSLLAGEFLVVPTGISFDVSRPPELAAVASAETSLPRTDASVPEQMLLEIQECFMSPPDRYSQPIGDTRTAFEEAAGRCRMAIAAHPDAPDLWIVRNRLIVSLLGLWKISADQRYLDEAIVASRAAISAECPPGVDQVARLCLARDELRQDGHARSRVVTEFLASQGGQQASGPALAVAVLLALDAADRSGYAACRRMILEKHSDHPMMWTVVSFLLDRYHQYRLFEPPFTAGWTPGRRAGYFLSLGTPEEAHRMLRTELEPLDGGSFRIPGDMRGNWTAIILAVPWRKDGPPSPERFARKLCDFAGRRPAEDLSVIVAVLDDDAGGARGLIADKPFPCPVMMVPGGMNNPLVQQLGILRARERLNAVLLRPDGSIAIAISGLVMKSKGAEETIPHVIEQHDEQVIMAALDRGDIEEAKRIAFRLAPPPEPESTTDRPGRGTKRPVSLPHLRARARVLMALEDWDRALADAEDVLAAETSISGGLSLRTPALETAEELRAEVLRRGRPPR